LPNAADEQIQEIPVVDTVMKRIEVVKVLKVDTVKLLPEEQAIVAEIRENRKLVPPVMRIMTGDGKKWRNTDSIRKTTEISAISRKYILTR